LGFELQGEVPGRSKQRLPLCIWRRDHGHPDLFSTAESLGLLRVALDVNVFLDLELDREREGAIESRPLADDWLADQIELVVTNELPRELARLSSGPEKSRQLRAAQRYHRLPADTGAIEATAQRIINHVARTQNVDLSADPSDMSDVRHVAEASLAGITVLATRDGRLLRWAAEAIDVCGVRVMRPADVVLHVDELSRAQAYRPIELQDTEYLLAPVRSGSEAELIAFLNASDGERKPEYMARVRVLLAEGRRWNRVVLRSPKSEPIAFYVVGTSDTELVVPIFRIRTPRLENTIARQLLSVLRDQARHEGRSIVRITDPSLSKYTEIAVRDNGFIRHRGSWIGFVISACADSATVDALAAEAAQSVDLRMPTLRPHLSPVIAAELERTLWPAKIIDSDLPSYLIPIRHTWSAELFGVPQTLMPRPNRLGISREHVYYRSPRPRVEQAPARLVWYVTGSRTEGLAAIIGCSRLDEISCDTPAVLYQAYRHLGVWQREEINRAASSGKALALRFADTEVFPRRVTLRRLRQLAAENRQRLALRSPQKISAELFAAIYQEGHPRA
jgi:predicted nucleic acid-binding protein